MQANKLIEEIFKISESLSSIPCESSVYELDDDEFGRIMYIRDICYEYLKDNNAIARDLANGK